MNDLAIAGMLPHAGSGGQAGDGPLWPNAPESGKLAKSVARRPLSYGRFLMTTRSRLGSLVLLFALLSACATSPTGRHQLSLVSEKTAIDASKESYITQMSELKSQGKLVTDPKVIQRVDRITGRLVAQAVMKRQESAKWEWSVEVIDDPMTVNAWCMAGGRMAVYTGLLNKVDPTDDELAQVMGHEISHALANHTAERMSVAMATKAGVALAGILSDNGVAALGVLARVAAVAAAPPAG